MAVRSTLVVPLLLAFALSGCAVRAKTEHTQAALPQTLSVGSLAPKFAYQLSGGRSISSNELRGHPYVLWIMATWCSSCQGGTSVVAQHIGQLRTHDVRVVQLEAANDLGYPGPPLSTFRRAVGAGCGRDNQWRGDCRDGIIVALALFEVR